MKKIIILFLLVSIAPSIASAQRSSRWKRMRYELVYGIGGTSFLGELGGANQIGTDLLRDVEFRVTRPMVHLGMRYKLLEKLSFKAALSVGMIAGDDKLTGKSGEQLDGDAIYRYNRNLHFRSMIAEFGGQFEYSIVRERSGHRYNLRRVRGIKGFKTNTYVFVGVGGFYFNPKANYDGSWQALQPLGTEGQGLVPTREKYSRVALCIPYGIGVKYGMSRKWSIGMEFGMRKTFTDYIDDVSKTYFDNDAISQNYGPTAAALADPHLEFISDSSYRAGEQRGNAADNDAYLFAIITLTYKLRTNRNGLPKF